MRPFQSVLTDLSFVLSLIDPEQRAMDPDPEKLGIEELRKTLASIAAALDEE